MSARFEIVRTDAEQPWHARFVGANGETVWTTENYLRRTDALEAISLIGRACYEQLDEPIRTVDERVQ